MLFYTEESYKADYHRAIDVFLKTYLESGDFEKEIDAMTGLLLPYVEKDPTALCSKDQFLSSSKALRTFILLRTESIRRQLEGNLATETEKQMEEEKVDASMLTIGDLT